MRTDTKFYLRVADLGWFAGQSSANVLVGWTDDPTGVDAIRAFERFDAQGKRLPCRALPGLARVLLAKAAVNLQIKMWADGVRDGTLPVPELREYCTHFGAPPWVEKAVLNQAERK
jgi:hypothetical protein